MPPLLRVLQHQRWRLLPRPMSWTAHPHRLPRPARQAAARSERMSQARMLPEKRRPWRLMSQRSIRWVIPDQSSYKFPMPGTLLPGLAADRARGRDTISFENTSHSSFWTLLVCHYCSPPLTRVQGQNRWSLWSGPGSRSLPASLRPCIAPSTACRPSLSIFDAIPPVPRCATLHRLSSLGLKPAPWVSNVRLAAIVTA